MIALFLFTLGDARRGGLDENLSDGDGCMLGETKSVCGNDGWVVGGVEASVVAVDEVRRA